MEAQLAALQAELAAERAARRAAEAHLDTLARHQQILLGATPYMTWFKDPAGRYVFCSDTFLRFVNLSREQVIGRTAAALFPADYAADIEANDRNAMQRGAVQTIAGYVRKGSRICWIETQKTPVYDEQGRLLGVLGTSIDVTDRQTTEALLARHARCAEGLARCSQDLLRDRSQSAPTDSALAAALEHLRHAVAAECAAVYACPPESPGATLALVVQVQNTAAPAHCPETLVLPERVHIALEGRCSWGGMASPAVAPHPSAPTLLLPIHVDGDWWGCLALYRAPAEAAWHPQELQALEVAAEMISAFVQSRNQTTALHRRIAELTALNRIVQSVTSSVDLRRSLKHVGLLVRELFNAGQVSFWLYDERGGRLRREVVSGRERTDAAPMLIDPAASAVAQQVLAQAGAILLDNAPQDPLLDAAPNGPIMLTRLHWWEAPLGVLAIQAANPEQRFAAAEIALAEMIAGTLAGAITNLRLLATEQRQRHLAESLRQVTLDLAGSLDLATLAGAIFTQLQRVLPCESAVVLLHTDDALQVVAGIGSAAAHVGRKIGMQSAHQVVTPFQTRRPQVSRAPDNQGAPDAEPALGHTRRQEPPWFPWEADVGPCRWIGVPLLRGQIPVGVLALDCCAVDRVDDEVIATLQAFAGHVAIAIDNAQRYEAAAERERQRLARELHDSVSQSLYFANLAAESLPVIWELDPDEGRQRLEELQRFTRSAQAEMRTLLIELRPDLLIDLPLHDALWRLIAVLTAKTAETQLDVHIDRVPALPPDVQIALYRIAQEALSNVVKHARAAEVHVHLTVAPAAAPNRPWHGTITLRITDNGRGFDPHQATPGRLGLTSLAERAAGIGATLSIASAPGGGTQVHVAWQREQAEDAPPSESIIRAAMRQPSRRHRR